MQVGDHESIIHVQVMGLLGQIEKNKRRKNLLRDGSNRFAPICIAYRIHIEDISTQPRRRSQVKEQGVGVL